MNFKIRVSSLIILSLFSCILQCESQGKNVTRCTTTEYFNPITLLCDRCGDNQEPYSDIGCQCKSGFSADKDQIGFIRGRNNAAVCQPCTGCSCGDGEALIPYNDDGSPIASPQCIKCDSNSLVNAKKECQRCPDRNMVYQNGKCECGSGFSLSQNICILSVDQNGIGGYGDLSSNFELLSYTNYLGIGNAQIRSVYVRDLYLKAAVGCQVYNDQVSCQQLANLCLLILDKSSLICQLYTSLQLGKQVEMPKLFFDLNGESVIKKTPMKMLINFKEDKGNQRHNLNYFLMEYDMDGSVSDIRPLGNELILCGSSIEEPKLSARFGIEYSRDCTLDLSKYIRSKDYQTKLYEMWLEDIDGTLISVPIRLYDLLDEAGSYPNRSRDWSLWRMSYRFYMIENQLGLEENNEASSVIKFAQSTVISYYINPDMDDKMYLPFVTIHYREKAVLQGQIADSNVDIGYFVEYTYEADTFSYIAGVLMVVTNIIVGVIWIVRIWIWSKCNPSYIAEQSWSVILFIRSIYLLLDTWSEGFFYYLFFMTGYWFCFYKLQESIYVLMPSMSDYGSVYRPFEAIFYTMFACRFIAAVNHIFQQSELEIFFIDWEKTEVMRPSDLEVQLRPDVKKAIEKYHSKTSVWRTLLIANEFNELQTFRIVSVEWTLLITGLFLIGLKWENFAAEQPNLNIDQDDNKNYVLTYFISCFVYMTVGLVQIIVRKLFDIWFPIQVEDFVDLCSMANISILIIDDILHGYYIHGENPLGYSEGSSEYLQNCLHYESQGKGKRRGFIQIHSNMHPDDENLQTFEIYLSLRFRESYDKVFMIPVRTQTDQANNVAYQQITIFRNPTPLDLNMHEVELNRSKLQYFLKDVLNQIRNNQAQFLRNKLPLQRFFGLPPPELDNPEFKEQSLPVFFRDPDHSFKNIFFCGKEFYFLVTDCIIFNFWLMITANTFASLLLAYLIIKGLCNYRAWLGERNLSDKSKIDQRFLI